MDEDSKQQESKGGAPAGPVRASWGKILLVLTLPLVVWIVIGSLSLGRINSASLPYVILSFGPEAGLAERWKAYGSSAIKSVRVGALLTYAKLYNSLYGVPYAPDMRYGAYVLNTGGTLVRRRYNQYFDWDADGFGEATSVGLANNQAFLLRGVPGPGGKIDGRDLLMPSTTAPWQALYDLDINGDHRLDAQDDAFADLMAWTDKNGNYNVDAGELYPLSYLVNAVDLSGEPPPSREPPFDRAFDSKQLEPGFTLDLVFFNYDETRTFWLDRTLPDEMQAELAGLPDLRGYGSMPDLRFAMAKNEKLRALVRTLATTPGIDLLMNAAATDALVREIMFTWAGVENTEEGSRGPIVEAKVVEWMEEFDGSEFYQIKRFYHPLPFGGRSLKEGWDIVFRRNRAALLAQTDASRIFAQISYDVRSDRLSAIGPINQRGLMKELKTRLKMVDFNNRARIWATVQDMITIAYGAPIIVTEDKMFTRR